MRRIPHILLIISLLCGILVSFPTTQSLAEGQDEPVWELHAGAWLVSFAEKTSNLTCRHIDTGITLSGSLSFLTRYPSNKFESWRIVSPRDSVRTRLAIQDNSDNIQGYIVFVPNGDALEVRPIHRTAQNYDGQLVYRAETAIGNQTFACRTQPAPTGSVIQMALGSADSRLNDSIFDITSDTTLQFGGGHRPVIFKDPDSAETPVFRCNLRAQIAEPANAAIRINLIRGYYQNRYAPYYRPINKDRCPVAPTGWMSWNTYFDTAGEKENLQEARIAAQHLKPYGMEFFSIESWQDNSPELPVSNFHNLTLRPDLNKFPSGMKWLADEIRKLGFRPGIWTVPFGTGDTAFYEAHKEWFLHDPYGKPMRNWCGRFVLDPSQPAVRNHMEETHRIISQDWGYEYFKIDGMSGRSDSYSAHFFERENVRAAFKEQVDDPFKLCAEALRRGIGEDRVWLACQGHYTGPDSGLADAGRIGADIVAHLRPPDWNNYLNQARTTLNQLFVNNIIWYCDPDTLLVGTANSIETVRLAATVVALTGQAMFAGDKLGELPPERMRLLQQCLPVCDIRPLDLFPVYDMLPVWDLKVRKSWGSWDVVSLFNWDENEAEIGVDVKDLGWCQGFKFLVYDCWNRKLHRGVQMRISAIVPGHANALLGVYPDTGGDPKVVFCDRHLVQGGIGLNGIIWDEDKNTLSGDVQLVGDDPTEMVIAVPERMTLNSAAAEPEATISAEPAENHSWSIKVQAPSSRNVHWSLSFKPLSQVKALQ